MGKGTLPPYGVGEHFYVLPKGFVRNYSLREHVEVLPYKLILYHIFVSRSKPNLNSAIDLARVVLNKRT